jgi:hypothetical protein
MATREDINLAIDTGTVCRSYAPGAEMGGGNTGC